MKSVMGRAGLAIVAGCLAIGTAFAQVQSPPAAKIVREMVAVHNAKAASPTAVVPFSTDPHGAVRVCSRAACRWKARQEET